HAPPLSPPSLHDALPICRRQRRERQAAPGAADRLLDVPRAEEVDLQLRSRTRAGRTLDRLDEARRAELQLLRVVEPSLRIGLADHPVANVAREEVADDLERVQRGIELCDRELHLPESLAAQRERR